MTFHKFSKGQIALLVTLWLAFLASFMTRLSWSSIMPTAMEALHFDVAQGALYISAFYMGYALTVLPGGMVADAFGYRKVILISLASMVLFTVPMYALDSYYVGLAYRFFLGFFSGPLHASCMSAIGDYFSSKQRGTAVGLYMTASSLGIALVNMMAPYVAAHYGWRMAFVAVALVPLLILSLATVTLSERTKETPLNGTKESCDSEMTKESSTFSRDTSIKENLMQVVTNRNILLLALAGLFATGSTWGVTNWANLYMVKQLGVTTVAAGAVMSSFGVAALIAKPCSGFLSDVISLARHKLAALFLFVFGPMIILFGYNQNIDVLYILGPLLGVSAFVYSPLTNTLGIQVAPAHLRGTTIGFINLFNQIGSLSAPLFLSRVITLTGDYQKSLYCIALFPVVAAIVLLCMRFKKEA